MVLSLTVHHVTDHMSLACLLSTLLRAVCWFLLPGCKFWCGRVLLLTRQAKPVKKQPSQDVLHGDAAEEELGLACLVSSYILPHQNSQPGERGRQTARSKVLSRRARDT